MQHEQQADVAALKILVLALMMEIADPAGARSNAEVKATLAAVRGRCDTTLAELTIDVTRSSASAASPFHEMVAAKLAEMLDSVVVGD